MENVEEKVVWTVNLRIFWYFFECCISYDQCLLMIGNSITFDELYSINRWLFRYFDVETPLTVSKFLCWELWASASDLSDFARILLRCVWRNRAMRRRLFYCTRMEKEECVNHLDNITIFLVGIFGWSDNDRDADCLARTDYILK